MQCRRPRLSYALGRWSVNCDTQLSIFLLPALEVTACARSKAWQDARAALCSGASPWPLDTVLLPLPKSRRVEVFFSTSPCEAALAVLQSMAEGRRQNAKCKAKK